MHTANIFSEFDCVILDDVDNKNYDINNILDMKLLYVGITRALHNLDVLYNDTKHNLYIKKELV